MTDKEQIRKNIEHIVQRKLNLLNGDVFDLTEETEGLTNEIIDSLQEEPVSEELEEAIDTYLATYFGDKKEMQNWPFLKKMAIHFANWQSNKIRR